MKYIIDFDNNLSIAEVDQYLVDNAITKIKQFGTFGHVFLVESTNEITTNDKIVNVVHDHEQGITLLNTEVELVDRGVPTSFNIEDIQNWWKVASINNIDFDLPTHNHMIRGTNSTVYIVDSGIVDNHPEFTNSNISLLYSFNNNFDDNRGHGTALASLIAGGTCSLTNPMLKVVKVFDTTQPTLQSDLLAGLDAIYADYVANGRKSSVINMSWAIPKNIYINSKIQYLIDEGMYVVASAGNSGQPIGDVTPASIPDVLTIGSYGQDLTPSKFSDYTGESSISYTANDVNHGALDGWGPGESIYSANRLGGYSYIAGTSAAAAIASAAFAYNLDIILQENGNIQDNLLIEKKLEYYSNLTVLRSDLLDLSDVKYNGSVNKTVTFISNTKTNPGVFAYKKYMKAETTTAFYQFNPNQIKKVSYEGQLPEGFTINDRGFLIVSYPDITQPLISLPVIEFDVTYRNDMTGIFKVNVVIWNKNYETIKETLETNQELIEDDPTLSYILQDDTQCFSSGNYACGDNFCQSQSQGALYCTPLSKFGNCNCI